MISSSVFETEKGIHIKEQIELIKKLEEKGYTYSTIDGIYFDTSKFKDYGKLARLKIEGLQAGARVELREGKKNKTERDTKPGCNLT